MSSRYSRAACSSMWCHGKARTCSGLRVRGSRCWSRSQAIRTARRNSVRDLPLRCRFAARSTGWEPAPWQAAGVGSGSAHSSGRPVSCRVRRLRRAAASARNATRGSASRCAPGGGGSCASGAAPPKADRASGPRAEARAGDPAVLMGFTLGSFRPGETGRSEGTGNGSSRALRHPPWVSEGHRPRCTYRRNQPLVKSLEVESIVPKTSPQPPAEATSSLESAVTCRRGRPGKV